MNEVCKDNSLLSKANGIASMEAGMELSMRGSSKTALGNIFKDI